MFFLAVALRVQLSKLPGLILLRKVYWDDRLILKSAKFVHLPSSFLLHQLLPATTFGRPAKRGVKGPIRIFKREMHGIAVARATAQRL